MKDSMLLLLTFATTGACSPVVLYTLETAPEESYNDEFMAEAQAKQPFLYSVLEQESWGDEQELQLVVKWSSEFNSLTWEGNIFFNMGGEEIKDTEYGKAVFMERMQGIYEEACKDESMHQAILRSIVWYFDPFTINHLLQSSILSFYPLLVDLLQTFDTSFVKMDRLPGSVSAELCYGKVSTYPVDFEKLVTKLLQDCLSFNAKTNVFKFLDLFFDNDSDLNTLRTVLSWGIVNVREVYEWAESSLDKSTQALLALPLRNRYQERWRCALRLVRFRELKLFPNLPKHLKSIKMKSGKLGREHLTLMLLFPEQSEQLSLMIWDKETSLRELSSILPFLPWQNELAMSMSLELDWNQLFCLPVQPTQKLVLAQAWFNNILESHIISNDGMNEISLIWKCSLSQPVILHQFYLRKYAPQDFDGFIFEKIRNYIGRAITNEDFNQKILFDEILPEEIGTILGEIRNYIGCAITKEDFNQEILFDEVLPKEFGNDDFYGILLLRILLTMVFDEKKSIRWVVAYLKTAKILRMKRSKVIKLILDEELAGPNREVWLAKVFSILRLFVPDFVFDDSPYTSVVELSTSIRRQINLPDSIGLIQILKQQKGISATGSLIPVISSKIVAEIGINNARVVEQMLTKLLRQTQSLAIENDYQNSSEILDNLYSRIDQPSFLRLIIHDANLDPLRVDEIVGFTLKSHGNSFIQTAMALCDLKENQVILNSL